MEGRVYIWNIKDDSSVSQAYIEEGRVTISHISAVDRITEEREVVECEFPIYAFRNALLSACTEGKGEIRNGPYEIVISSDNNSFRFSFSKRGKYTLEIIDIYVPRNEINYQALGIEWD